jgi:hypothetical protein
MVVGAVVVSETRWMSRVRGRLGFTWIPGSGDGNHGYNGDSSGADCGSGFGGGGGGC